jgi:hypothetical protein
MAGGSRYARGTREITNEVAAEIERGLVQQRVSLLRRRARQNAGLVMRDTLCG